MQQGQRYKGFVVGCDPAPQGIVWKVKVKEAGSPYDGQKLVVASIRDNIALANGLDVNFTVGTVKGEKGKDLRAVDVQLEAPKGS